MIKRSASLILALLAALTFIACGSAPSAPSGAEASATAGATESAQTDMPHTAEPQKTSSAEVTSPPDDDTFYVVDFNDAYCSTGAQQILETNDSVYYLCCPTIDTSIVYFSDKEYKDWIPLCSKPDCLHGPKDNNCNAHLEGATFARMWLYGRHIYYCVRDLNRSEFSLWRMKLDGSDHEKLLEFPKDENASIHWFFHNKYVFVNYSSVVGTEGEFKSTTYYVDLSQTPVKASVFKLVDENGDPAVGFRTVVIGRGDGLYCLSNDEQNLVYCVDIAAGTRRTICQQPAYLGPLGTGLYDDTLLFCYGWELGEIISADINTGELTVVNKAEPQTMKWYQSYGGYIFGCAPANSLNPSLKGTSVYDLNGELINDIPYESYNTEILLSYMLGNYVYGHQYCEDGAKTMEEPPQWYLDIRDIGTDNLMWRRWEP